MTFAVT